MSATDTKVHEIMKSVDTFEYEDTPMSEAICNMVTNGHASAIVVAKGHNKFVGVVTGADIVDAVAHPSGEEELENSSVAEFMISHPVTLALDDTVSKAAKVMDRQGFQYLVVVDKSYCPVGIVSRMDIIRWWAKEHCNLPT